MQTAKQRSSSRRNLKKASSAAKRPAKTRSTIGKKVSRSKKR